MKVEFRWFLWLALFGVGILNGLLVTGVFESTTSNIIIPIPVPQPLNTQNQQSTTTTTSSQQQEEQNKENLSANEEEEDSLGIAERGNISDWCYAIRPTSFPLGDFLVSPSEVSSCPRYVATASSLSTFGTLGERILSWSTTSLISVAWELPLAVIGANPLESCGKESHQKGSICSPNAEVLLGLNRGIPRVSALLKKGFTTMKVTVSGTSIDEIINENPSKNNNPNQQEQQCNVIYLIEAPLPHLQDLSSARWALSSRLGKAFRRSTLLGNSKILYKTDSVSVAIHLGKTTSPSISNFNQLSKPITMNWAQQLLWQIVKLCDSGNFRNAAEKWGGSQSVQFSGNSYAPLHIYAFIEDKDTNTEWLNVMLPNKSQLSIIAISEAETIKHLATADILICTNSTLCGMASLHTTRGLALVPTNHQTYDYNPCPGDIKCINDNVDLTQELRLHILDVLDRWLISRSANCPNIWNYPY